MMATGQELKPGDHIYTKCFGGLYDHRGIYVGKAKVKNPRTGKKEQIENGVIHLLGLDKNGKAKTYQPQCPKCFHESHELRVVLTCLDCFHEGNTIHRYEYEVSLLSFTFKSSGSCSTFTSSEPDVVIKRAYSFLHKKKLRRIQLPF
ncbi:hypothetical protein ES288_D13G212500v1 [Gossypium darwinii]|uniref:LRAT domain-containing protein n=2 Tax=Gossypium TaxID=3633 RepID=A0A5D2HZK6_GOSTO|nr:hypothetical protein ES288_D13G212500v1 [Gossypium darwinii]TYH35735.1 hypothetical protein ES332_D13G213600v1 [Gossypium tomentosum]